MFYFPPPQPTLVDVEMRCRICRASFIEQVTPEEVKVAMKAPQWCLSCAALGRLHNLSQAQVRRRFFKRKH